MKQFQIVALGQFDCAQRSEVRRDELAVEQLPAAHP